MSKKTTKHASHTPKWIKWDLEPLGMMTDAELARKLGVRTSAVRYARVKRKIERYKGPGRPAKND